MPDNETPHLTDGQIIALPEVGGEAAVLRHMETCADCRARVAAWREARAIVSGAGAEPGMDEAAGCPAMEELASYAAGESGPSADEITAHVAGCARCAAILRDSLESPSEGAIPMSATTGGSGAAARRIIFRASGNRPRGLIGNTRLRRPFC